VGLCGLLQGKLYLYRLTIDIIENRMRLKEDYEIWKGEVVLSKGALLTLPDGAEEKRNGSGQGGREPTVPRSITVIPTS
jgi:hypothetical protein